MYKKIKRIIEEINGNTMHSDIQIICPKMYLGIERARYCICPTKVTKASIIYSFGVGNDISFDLSMIERFGVNVYAFDPTPNSTNWIKSQKLPKEFHYFDFAIADYDGIAQFHAPKDPKHFSYTMLDIRNRSLETVMAKVFKIKTIMNMLGHEKVDILKMDIEGAEYAVIEDLLSSNVVVDQLLVEFHHRFKKIGVSKTTRAIELLNRKGFMIFDISLKGYEFSFLRI